MYNEFNFDNGFSVGYRIFHKSDIGNWLTIGSDPDSSIVVSTTNLYLYYDAGIFNSYVGGGTAINDISGNGLDGTLRNGPTYSSSDGGTLMFDGSNDYIEPGNIPDSFWQNNYTVSLWVKLGDINTSTSGIYDRVFVQHGSTSTRRGLHLSQRDNGMHFGLYGDDLDDDVTNLVLNRWYNLVFTYQESGSIAYLKTYVDGSLSASKTTSGQYIGTGSNTRIFGGVLFGRSFFGTFSSLAFYNATLSASTILSNYNAFVSRVKPTLQSSGSIALSQIQNVLGGSNPISMSEYYGADTGIPASGAIDMSDFYGAEPSGFPFTATIAGVGGGGGGGNAQYSSTSGGGGGGCGGTFKILDRTVSSTGTTWNISIGGGGSSGSQGVRTRVAEGSTIHMNAQWGGRGASYNLAANNGGGGSGANSTYSSGVARSSAANGGDGGDGIAYSSGNANNTGLGGGGGGGGPSGADGNDAAVQFFFGAYGGSGGAGTNDSTWGQYAGGGGGGGNYAGSGYGRGGSGGGGNGSRSSSNAVNGSTNTGSGGGGGSPIRTSGGNGASGRCSIRVPDTVYAVATTGNPSVYASGGYRTYTWTSSGSITW